METIGMDTTLIAVSGFSSFPPRWSARGYGKTQRLRAALASMACFFVTGQNLSSGRAQTVFQNPPLSADAGATSSQRRAVIETKPILQSYNDLTESIASAFDNDVNSTAFSQGLRQLVLNDLREVRSGLTAIVRDSKGMHEGNPADIRKIGPNLRIIANAMKEDRRVIRCLERFEECVAPVLPTVDARHR
jgi:hypothetical protein